MVWYEPSVNVGKKEFIVCFTRLNENNGLLNLAKLNHLNTEYNTMQMQE